MKHGTAAPAPADVEHIAAAVRRYPVQIVAIPVTELHHAPGGLGTPGDLPAAHYLSPASSQESRRARVPGGVPLLRGRMRAHRGLGGGELPSGNVRVRGCHLWPRLDARPFDGRNVHRLLNGPPGLLLR